ncbi:hypothetical protein GCM10008983_13390 [Lentibacillus halophilus]|uniref:Lipoprotein n=1 Tax=Lentibacillus halophilus TaxID=295065 RepID=A0ABN0Z8K7_9BACI
MKKIFFVKILSVGALLIGCDGDNIDELQEGIIAYTDKKDSEQRHGDD